MKTLCQAKTPQHDEHQKSQQMPSQQENATDSQWVEGRAAHIAQRPPIQTSNSRQFVYRSQSYDNSTVATSSNPGLSPFQQSQYGAYSEQNPAWNQATATLDPTGESYLNATTFQYPTESAHSFRTNYGEGEMDHSHGNLHSWAFPADVGFDRARSRQDAMGQPPTPYGLSPEEFRAFFGNNRGQ